MKLKIQLDIEIDTLDTDMELQKKNTMKDLKDKIIAVLSVEKQRDYALTIRTKQEK